MIKPHWRRSVENWNAIEQFLKNPRNDAEKNAEGAKQNFAT
ncbi:MAG TPA: hypothetical protein VIM07_06270 [Chitinophagaceae bacterium]